MITRNRKVYIVGDITYLAFLEFSKAIGKLEEKSSAQIHIVLSSEGGNAQAALAFYDRIRASPCPVSITGTGLVASAAALILVAVTDVKMRTMTPSSWLMVHDDNIGDTTAGMRVVHAARYVKQLVAFENQWNKLMSLNTGLSIVEWDKLHKKETYLSVSECVKIGVIGGII